MVIRVVNKTFFIKQARYLHRLLLWPALLALVAFVLSGFMHILMTWTGPQTTVTKLPSQSIAVEQVQALPAVLEKHHINEAIIIKLVPSPQGSLLQVTQSRQASRRYFDLRSGEELPGYDEVQARWLANYYRAGVQHDGDGAIKTVSLQTVFDKDYPWVNRLLPVYKVVYEGDDILTLYVHTESLALASISNNWKQQLQNIFRQFHTWHWLENFPQARIAVMMILLSSLFAMVAMGITLLSLLRRSQLQESTRRWHRALAYVVCIPLFGFVASGSYHLLYSEYATTVRDFNLSRPLLLSPDNQALGKTVAPLPPPGQSLNSIALIRIGDQFYYRSSIAENPAASGEHDHHNAHSHLSDNKIRQQRFDGINTEQSGNYMAVFKDAVASPLNDETLDDEKVARLLAMDYLGLAADNILAVEKITRFGPDYDFRNKRLPVWRVVVTTETAQQDILFIDVASGLLVDRVSPASRLEGYSFSILHKWNFLTGLIGREKRDALMVLVLSLALLLAVMGLILRLKSRREAV